MKKFLFSLAAFAIALTASAQDKAVISVSGGQTVDLDGEKYKTVTIALDNKTERVGWQSNFYLPKTAEIVSVMETGDLESEVKVGLKKERNYEINFSQTSNVDNTPVFLANFRVAAGKVQKVIESGDIYTIYFTAESTGSVKIVSVGTEDLVFDIDEVVTAAKVVSADEAVATTKTVENGQVVIVKNGKKYTAAGAQIK